MFLSLQYNNEPNLNFNFPNVPFGKYDIKAYFDMNGNSNHDSDEPVKILYQQNFTTSGQSFNITISNQQTPIETGTVNITLNFNGFDSSYNNEKVMIELDDNSDNPRIDYFIYYNSESTKTVSLPDVPFGTYTIRAYFELDGEGGWSRDSSTEPGVELTEQEFLYDGQNFTLTIENQSQIVEKGSIHVYVNVDLTYPPSETSYVVIKLLDNNNNEIDYYSTQYTLNQDYIKTFDDVEYGTYTVMAFIDKNNNHLWEGESIDYVIIKNSIQLDTTDKDVNLNLNDTPKISISGTVGISTSNYPDITNYPGEVYVALVSSDHIDQYGYWDGIFSSELKSLGNYNGNDAQFPYTISNVIPDDYFVFAFIDYNEDYGITFNDYGSPAEPFGVYPEISQDGTIHTITFNSDKTNCDIDMIPPPATSGSIRVEIDTSEFVDRGYYDSSTETGKHLYVYIKDYNGNIIGDIKDYEYKNDSTVTFTFNDIPFNETDGYTVYAFFDIVDENGEIDDYEPNDISDTVFITSSNPTDTVYIYNLSLPVYGKVEGTITIPNPSDYSGESLIVLLKDEYGNSVYYDSGFSVTSFTIQSDQTEYSYHFNDVNLGGNYHVEAFIDEDNEGDYDISIEPGNKSKDFDITEASPVYKWDTEIEPIVVKNFDFNNPGYVDSDDTYKKGSTVTDIIPEWTLGVACENDYEFKMEFQIVDNDDATGKMVLLKENASISDGHSMYMQQDFDNSYTVTNNTKLKIKFKYTSFAGGNPPGEAPLKVFLKVNGSWIQIIAKSPYGEGPMYASEDDWITIDISLAGLTFYGNTVVSLNDLIQGIKIQSLGWYWETYIDYVEIYEDTN